jgi:hypothetical protein
MDLTGARPTAILFKILLQHRLRLNLDCPLLRLKPNDNANARSKDGLKIGALPPL